MKFDDIRKVPFSLLDDPSINSRTLEEVRLPSHKDGVGLSRLREEHRLKRELSDYNMPKNRSPLLYYDLKTRPTAFQYPCIANASREFLGSDPQFVTISPKTTLAELQQETAQILGGGKTMMLNLVPMNEETVFCLADKLGAVARGIVRSVDLGDERHNEQERHQAVIEVLKNAFTHGNCFDVSWPIFVAYDPLTKSLAITDCRVSHPTSPTRHARESYLNRKEAFNFRLGGEGVGLRTISKLFNLSQIKSARFSTMRIEQIN